MSSLAVHVSAPLGALATKPGTAARDRSMVRNIYLGLFAIALVLSPIYLFEPGLPQPPDFLMAFLILILATGYIIKLPLPRDLYLVAALFLGYVTLVNLYWWSQYGGERLILTPFYYAFNFGTFMLVVSLLMEFRERFVVVCKAALAGAIALEVVALLLNPADGFRSVGTFNNPNQLGYWGILVGICVLLFQRDEKLTLPTLAVLCGAGYVVMEGLSKAAMVGFVLLLLLGVVFQGLSRPSKVALVGLVLGGTSLALVQTSVLDHLRTEGLTGKVVQRFETVGKHDDDSIAGRGYDRIWRYPEHLLFGAGEGAWWRFAGPINRREHGKELHSTLGTVLFSYGYIGSLLFCALLFFVFRRAPLSHMLYTLPIWAYGMTHQGMRDTMFWVVLGLVFGLARYAQSASPVIAPSAAEARQRLLPAHGLRPQAIRSTGQ
jgi:hypothetical protein